MNAPHNDKVIEDRGRIRITYKNKIAVGEDLPLHIINYYIRASCA